MNDTENLNDIVESLKSFTLLQKPVYGFKECFMVYTKEDMVLMADIAGINVRRSKTKPVITQDFFEGLVQKSRYTFKYQHPKNIALLKELIKGPKKIDIGSLAEENPYAFNLILFGWIFLFEDRTNGVSYTLVLPDETKPLVETFVEDANFKKEYKRVHLLQDYLNAFFNLYGAFESAFLLEVWNKQNKSFSYLIEDFIYECLLLGDYNEKFALTTRGKIFYDKTAIDKSDVDYLISSGAVHDYYRPTKDDIAYYAVHEYDTRTPYYKNMKQFFSKLTHSNNLDGIMEKLMINITLDNRMQEFATDLYEGYGVEFDEEKDLTQFAQLYMDLNNHTRKWINRGNTPNDIFKRHTGLSSLSNNVVPFRNKNHETQPPIQTKKVGRNEPCPCGSGKKYKHCHGK